MTTSDRSSVMNSWGYLVRSLGFLVLVAGLGAGIVPFALVPRVPTIETGFLVYLAFPLWLLGGLAVLWCFWDFALQGHGTPVPIEPPRVLVTTGLYRYVRNPIYLAALVLIIGHLLWFKSIWMLVYAVVLFIGFHLFVTLYEEPTLKRKFGTAYENYLDTVPRWIPRFR